MTARVAFTPKAAALVRQLKDRYGALVFQQSGGCCEGSAPMCFRAADFHAGSADVLLGTIAETPFYVSRAQYPIWDGYELVTDAIESAADSFSLETSLGKRFITEARVLEEAQEDADAGIASIS